MGDFVENRVQDLFLWCLFSKFIRPRNHLGPTGNCPRVCGHYPSENSTMTTDAESVTPALGARSRRAPQLNASQLRQYVAPPVVTMRTRHGTLAPHRRLHAHTRGSDERCDVYHGPLQRKLHPLSWVKGRAVVVGVTRHRLPYRTGADCQQCIRDSKPTVVVAHDMGTGAVLLDYCTVPGVCQVNTGDHSADRHSRSWCRILTVFHSSSL